MRFERRSNAAPDIRSRQFEVLVAGGWCASLRKRCQRREKFHPTLGFLKQLKHTVHHIADPYDRLLDRKIMKPERRGRVHLRIAPFLSASTDFGLVGLLLVICTKHYAIHSIIRSGRSAGLVNNS